MSLRTFRKVSLFTFREEIEPRPSRWNVSLGSFHRSKAHTRERNRRRIAELHIFCPKFVEILWPQNSQFNSTFESFSCRATLFYLFTSVFWAFKNVRIVLIRENHGQFQRRTFRNWLIDFPLKFEQKFSEFSFDQTKFLTVRSDSSFDANGKISSTRSFSPSFKNSTISRQIKRYLSFKWSSRSSALFSLLSRNFSCCSTWEILNENKTKWNDLSVSRCQKFTFSFFNLSHPNVRSVRTFSRSDAFSYGSITRWSAFEAIVKRLLLITTVRRIPDDSDYENWFLVVTRCFTVSTTKNHECYCLCHC